MAKATEVKKAQEKSEAEVTRKAIAQAVADSIVKEGSKIVVPLNPDMTYEEAAQALLDKAEEQNAVMSVHEVVEGNPFDALVALHEVLKQEFGWSTAKGQTVTGFFGMKFDVPPRMLDIRTGPKPEDVIQVPVGDISAPGLGFSFRVSPNKDGMHIEAEAKRVHAERIHNIAIKTREYLKEHSIYRGKAFKMPERWDLQPEFLSFDHIDPNELVLNRDLERAVQRFLFAQIERTKDLAALKVPSKWMAVLSGEYGTGKSFLMAILAKKALEHGRTVIYADDTRKIADAIVTGAERYGPILVIAEDLDRVVYSRGEEANAIINTISGVLSNSMQAMVVVSTNHPERIEKAMIRPGRVDVFLHIERPNAEAVERLIHVYGRGHVQTNGHYGEVARQLAGQVASTVRGAVELAKSGAAWEGRDTITEDDLLAAVTVMRPQLELLNAQKPEEVPPFERAFRAMVRQATLDSLADYQELVGVYYNDENASEIADDLEYRAERVPA